MADNEEIKLIVLGEHPRPTQETKQSFTLKDARRGGGTGAGTQAITPNKDESLILGEFRFIHRPVGVGPFNITPASQVTCWGAAERNA